MTANISGLTTSVRGNISRNLTSELISFDSHEEKPETEAGNKEGNLTTHDQPTATWAKRGGWGCLVRLRLITTIHYPVCMLITHESRSNSS